MEEALEVLSKGAVAMFNWAKKKGFKISTSKSVVCPFTRKNRIPLGDTINLWGSLFLKNTKLTWTNHINNLKGKVIKYLNILKVVCHTQWGADPDVSLMYYRATIRSVLDFGSIFYGQCCDSRLSSLQVIQNSLLLFQFYITRLRSPFYQCEGKCLRIGFFYRMFQEIIWPLQ